MPIKVGPLSSAVISLSSVTAVAGNILNNGDFSKGFSCYSAYEWSDNHQFLLSTNSRSGGHAAEIYCANNCSKAAIFPATGIPVMPGRSYAISLYTKCQPGSSGALYLPKTTTGNFLRGISCNGSWNQTKVTFTPAAEDTTFSFSIYNEGAGSFLIDDIVLTYSDGTTPTPSIWIHPGTRNVSLSPTTVSVDGKPYLAMGFYGVPPSHYSTVASLGANTILVPPDCFSTGGEDSLDLAYGLGLNVLPDFTMATRSGLDNGITKSGPGSAGTVTLPSAAMRFAPHLANIGTFLVDEPDQGAVNWYLISPLTLVSEALALRQHAKLPTLVDFQHAAWTTENSAYNGSGDIWMAEPYGTSFKNVTHAITTLESIHRRPIWLFNNDIVSTLIVPKAYWEVVQGATGIIYFDFDSFYGNPAGYAAVHQVFAELGSLKGAIFGVGFSMTPPSGITAIGRYSNGTHHILAVNPNTVNVTGKFSVPGLAAGKTITVLFENRKITSTSGGFSDSFIGISRHVYAF